MALPASVDRIVIRDRWLDENTGLGVRDGTNPATVTFEPVQLGGASGTPNLRDFTAHARVKTRPVTATVNQTTGYLAAVVTASNDPDLDPYAGRRVTYTGETPFLIAVPYNAPLVTVDVEMAAAVPGLTVGQQVRAIWLSDVPVVGVTPPAPAPSYYTVSQTLAAIGTGIGLHDADPNAHPSIRALISSGGSGAPLERLVHTRQAAINLSGHRVVTPDVSPFDGKLVYASNNDPDLANSPLWLTTAAAAAGANVTVVTSGTVTESSWSWAPGPVWLGLNGQLTQTPPAAPAAVFSVQVGQAVTATTITVNRGLSILL